MAAELGKEFRSSFVSNLIFRTVPTTKHVRELLEFSPFRITLLSLSLSLYTHLYVYLLPSHSCYVPYTSHAS